MAESTKSAWALPELDLIEINYTLRDRWSDLGEFGRWRDCVNGVVKGIVFEGESEDGGEEEHELGKVRLSIVYPDMVEGTSFADALDTDGHLGNFMSVADQLEEYSRAVLVEEISLVEQARGRHLGLHIAARAIEQWAQSFDVVGFSPGRIHGLNSPPLEVLKEYWGRLGLVEADDDKSVLLHDHSLLNRAIEENLVWGYLSR